jgi:hypothetical protein
MAVLVGPGPYGRVEDDQRTTKVGREGGTRSFFLSSRDREVAASLNRGI